MTDTSLPKKTSRAHAAHISNRPLRLRQHDNSEFEREVRIEIIPLIDVIFCILTFFILGSLGLARQQAISMDLPKASTGAPTAQVREMLLVSLDDIGQVYVEHQAVTRNQLFDAIKNFHQFNPSGLMVLNASRNANYNDVVQVLDMLREVGGNRVALATLPGKSESPNNFLPDIPSTNPNAFPSGLSSGYPSQQTLPTNPNQGLNRAAGTTPQVPNPALPGN